MLAASLSPHDERARRLEVKLRRELGEEVLALLADGRTEDILLNADSSLWVKRRRERFVRLGEMAPSQAASALGTIAALRGTVLNHDNPILETELPLDGSRFEGIVSPVTRNAVFAIHLRPRTIYTLDDYERKGILTNKEDPLNRARRQDNFAASVRGLPHRQIIEAAIRARKSILNAGATASGKTTLTNGYLDTLARLAPDDRVITIEDTIELQCAVKNWLDLHAVGKVSMLDCLRASMRLRPTRIVVGEVRGPEVHAVLKAWGTGHPGGMATVHANSAIEGLGRLESLMVESDEGRSMPHEFRRSLIAEAVDVVVFIDEEPTIPAGRKVREVLLVSGYRDGEYVVESA
jgi:P-type conjugative transfer ATPase TrbB